MYAVSSFIFCRRHILHFTSPKSQIVPKGEPSSSTLSHRDMSSKLRLSQAALCARTFWRCLNLVARCFWRWDLKFAAACVGFRVSSIRHTYNTHVRVCVNTYVLYALLCTCMKR